MFALRAHSEKTSSRDANAAGMEPNRERWELPWLLPVRALNSHQLLVTIPKICKPSTALCLRRPWVSMLKLLGSVSVADASYCFVMMAR